MHKDQGYRDLLSEHAQCGEVSLHRSVGSRAASGFMPRRALGLVFTLCLSAAPALCMSSAAVSVQDDGWPQERVVGAHLQGGPRAAVEQAIARGGAWLRKRQGGDGGFLPMARKEVCPVALSALALWAIVQTGQTTQDRRVCLQLSEFLASHRQEDGGIYDPRRGFAVYTSGIAAQALHSYHGRSSNPDVDKLWRNAEIFAQRGGVPESLVDEDAVDGTRQQDSAARARSLLGTSTSRSAGPEGQEAADATAEVGEGDKRKRALEFLAGISPDTARRQPLRTRLPGGSPQDLGATDPLSYDDILRLIYLDLRPEHQVVQRAQAAIRSSYTLERNPDLTKRYGSTGFQRGTQGLYYYYLALARSLATGRRPLVETDDGKAFDWVRELALRLVRLQAPDGSWRNEDGRWWEDEPVLVTTYALLALDLCRRMPPAPPGSANKTNALTNQPLGATDGGR